jgi:hypothetical protein
VNHANTLTQSCRQTSQITTTTYRSRYSTTQFGRILQNRHSRSVILEGELLDLQRNCHFVNTTTSGRFHFAGSDFFLNKTNGSLKIKDNRIYSLFLSYFLLTKVNTVLMVRCLIRVKFKPNHTRCKC